MAVLPVRRLSPSAPQSTSNTRSLNTKNAWEPATLKSSNPAEVNCFIRFINEDSTLYPKMAPEHTTLSGSIPPYPLRPVPALHQIHRVPRGHKAPISNGALRPLQPSGCHRWPTMSKEYLELFLLWESRPSQCHLNTDTTGIESGTTIQIKGQQPVTEAGTRAGVAVLFFNNSNNTTDITAIRATVGTRQARKVALSCNRIPIAWVKPVQSMFLQHLLGPQQEPEPSRQRSTMAALLW